MSKRKGGKSGKGVFGSRGGRGQDKERSGGYETIQDLAKVDMDKLTLEQAQERRIVEQYNILNTIGAVIQNVPKEQNIAGFFFICVGLENTGDDPFSLHPYNGFYPTTVPGDFRNYMSEHIIDGITQYALSLKPENINWAWMDNILGEEVANEMRIFLSQEKDK